MIFESGVDFMGQPAPRPPATIIIAISGAYLILVLSGREFMKDRTAIKPRKLLAFHNAILCLFSLLTFVSLAYLTISSGYQSAKDFFCDKNDALFKSLGDWTLFAFLMSKVWELLDTAFLVVQKSRLRFLHVFHHAITLVLSWKFFVDHYTVGWLCALLNSGVHTPMYFYYTVAALGGNCWWKKYLTTIQITQFVICIVAMAYDTTGRLAFGNCSDARDFSIGSLFSAVVCYSVFLGLFIQLYHENYVEGAKKKQLEKTQ